ncbi:MAG: tetratricopeptide repeat protein [Candidatus Omnitrophota bacterium]
MNKISFKLSSRFFGLIMLAVFLNSNTNMAFAAKAKEKEPAAAGPTTPEGQNVEKIIYTLNETLKENRRVRQNMRDLQDSFEKLTAEKNELASEVQLARGGVATKEREISSQSDALKGELDASRKEIEKLESGTLETAVRHQEIAAKNQELKETNDKLKGLLNQSVLEPERSRILDLAKRNEAGVNNSVNMVAGVNSENLSLKDQLVGACFDLGNVYYDLGRYDDSIVQYKKALRLNPKLAWAYHNLAIIYDYHLAQQDEARTYYQQYLNLKPPSEEAKKIRMRLWDLNQLSRIEPDAPLKKDFEELQKAP